MWATRKPCPSYPRLCDAVGFGRSLIIRDGMRPLGVVEIDPRADHPFGPKAIGQMVQADGLVLGRTPQAFDIRCCSCIGDRSWSPTVHDRDQVREAVLNRDVGDVDAPDLMGVIDREPIDKIGINSMRRTGFVGSRRSRPSAWNRTMTG